MGRLAPELPWGLGFGGGDLSNRRGPTAALPCRVILLLTNAFDLEDGFLTASNLEQVKGYLASAYPGQYAEVFPQIKNCSLEAELDTVSAGAGEVSGDGTLCAPPAPRPLQLC